ncbi:hypothetical protein M8998_09590 [Sphingobacterium sp. lm-10]|uniref:hypothetical protein n=1 Tax=Sphingobacterium sp. lm-10 TaxID=2944904 RepID=UPI002021AAA3|nr:hypothetical protein [Sphingobacterium sp. lm-10]MCL7988188.1 hypothetical protein [Sphingobacterium sp. lm-10]
MKFSKQIVLLACGLTLTAATAFAHGEDHDKSPTNETTGIADKKAKDVGTFTAEGKTHSTKFVRVLYAAEGSEIEGQSNDITPVVYESTDPKGNAVKVRRFQITAKNTGYDEVQTDQSEDYKLKSVKEGIKLYIEVPVAADGTLDLKKAYVGNAAYNFGTHATRHALTPETSSDFKVKIKRLDLPKFDTSNKPGDKGLIYNQGFIELAFKAKAKHLDSDQISDFTVDIKGPISITHVRGKEREEAAVVINPALVSKNL